MLEGGEDHEDETQSTDEEGESSWWKEPEGGQGEEHDEDLKSISGFHHCPVLLRL